MVHRENARPTSRDAVGQNQTDATASTRRAIEVESATAKEWTQDMIGSTAFIAGRLSASPAVLYGVLPTRLFWPHGLTCDRFSGPELS